MNKEGVSLCFFFRLKNKQRDVFGFSHFARMDRRRLQSVLLPLTSTFDKVLPLVCCREVVASPSFELGFAHLPGCWPTSASVGLCGLTVGTDVSSALAWKVYRSSCTEETKPQRKELFFYPFCVKRKAVF